MTDKKYALVPGRVQSQHDGDWHYISPSQLMRLYGVSRDDCVVLPDLPYYSSLLRAYEGLIRLYPLYSGRYKERMRRISDDRLLP